MTGLERQDLDFLDEEYLGPPPRFLVEDTARDRNDNALIDDDPESNRPIDRLKSFFDNWLS